MRTLKYLLFKSNRMEWVCLIIGLLFHHRVWLVRFYRNFNYLLLLLLTRHVPNVAKEEYNEISVKPCPHCRWKVRQSHFSATVWTGYKKYEYWRPTTSDRPHRAVHSHISAISARHYPLHFKCTQTILCPRTLQWLLTHMTGDWTVISQARVSSSADLRYKEKEWNVRFGEIYEKITSMH